MFLLCKLFSTAIHSMGYFCDVTRLYADEWKLMFLCPNQLGHCIIYFYLIFISFVTSQLSAWLLIRVKNCILYKLLEVNCNQTKSTPKNLFKMCDFWMYSVNLGVMIRHGVNGYSGRLD